MPEIGAGVTFLLSLVALIAGVYIETHVPLVWQVLIFAGLVFFLTSKAIRALELGAGYYIIIGAVFCLGMALGDINYFFQKHTDIHISNPFKVS